MIGAKADPPGRPIPGHPGYFVGRDGSAWKFLPGRRGRDPRYRPIRPATIARQLWLVVGPKGGRTFLRLDSLVLSLWAEPRPLGFEAIHFPDADYRNCRAENLRWGPKGAAVDHAGQIANLPVQVPGSRHHNAKLTPHQVAEARRLYREGWTIADVALELVFGES